ncbi:MAG: nitrilase family protein [Bacteroidales bacterium]|nr:nitrilase family protein [Bacteroidales bacterium]
MKVTVLQTDTQWAQPISNQEDVHKLLDTAEKSELYVLPEMWATGFVTSPENIAEDYTSDSSLQWMKTTAGERQCAICGSLSVFTHEKKYVNRQYFVLPDGSFYCYDKHHLFTYGGEDRCYSAGNKRIVAQYKGVRFLLQTCYDLRFPVWMRNTGDYDAIILVANWPGSRLNAWQTLTRARAIENQCYVIAANRTGIDPTCQYGGSSAIIDPYGRVMAEAETDKVQTITADIDMARLQAFREKFPVLNDRDAFEL